MRFGIVLMPQSGVEWTRTVTEAESQGYRTLMLPDTLYTPSPLIALAAAAAVTDNLRLRPNVLAAPFRSAATTVRETSALQLLSNSRFELAAHPPRPHPRRTPRRRSRRTSPQRSTSRCGNPRNSQRALRNRRTDRPGRTRRRLRAGSRTVSRRRRPIRRG
ncbi:LLM class flavin-dependent oxidoreductase [Nocardia sp. NPDC059195]|uniref:LLM class flavin-dependent oxidoreductase n=1 Tax=Nocardia sp. NPDC059195 TaxID=3346765 RepID=UPI003677CD7E